MKKTDLVSLLEKAGFIFLRNGGNHDIYVRDGKIVPVPRHKEINEQLAKSIIKKHGLK
jgi:mRNA interferase HicA